MRYSVGTRDKLAHRRAYHDLSKATRDFLGKAPEPPKEEKLKPKALKEKQGIPFRELKGSVFLGCTDAACPEWVDVTKVFDEHIFDGVYECPRGHRTVFAGR